MKAYLGPFLTWTPAKVPPTMTAFTEVYKAGDKYFALANQSTDSYLISDDGVVWSVQSGFPSAGVWRVAYGNGIYLAIARGTLSVAWSADGEIWEEETPIPASGANAYDIRYSGGYFWVSMSTGTNTWRTTDGTNWESVGLPGTISSSFTMVSAAGIYIYQYRSSSSTTNPTSYYFSTDGEVWEPINMDPVSGRIWAANELFMFVPDYPSSTDPYKISTDGRTWTPIEFPVNVRATAFAYANGQYVAVAGTNFLTSPDGVTWAASPFPASGATDIVGGGSDGFIVVGNGVYTSVPGLEWRTQEFRTPVGWRDMVLFKGLYVAMGNMGIAVSSPTYTDWRTTPLPQPGVNYRLIDAGDRLVVHGLGRYIFFSTDGLNWTASSPLPVGIAKYAVAASDIRVVVITITGAGYYSDDWGLNWVEFTPPAPVPNPGSAIYDMRALVYGADKFVYIGEDYQVHYSLDGETWLLADLPVSAVSASYRYQIMYGGGRYMLLDGYGQADGSPPFSDNGVNWSVPALPAVSLYTWSITAGDSGYVAVLRGSRTAANEDRVAYSDDGVFWRFSSLPIKGNWTRATYGLGKFWTANGAASDQIAYSDDGETWTAVTLPIAAYWAGVYFDGTSLYTYDASGYTTNPAEILHSTDGLVWERDYSGVIGFMAGSGDRTVATRGSNYPVIYTDDHGDNWDAAYPDTTQTYVSTLRWLGYDGAYYILSGSYFDGFWRSPDLKHWEFATATLESFMGEGVYLNYTTVALGGDTLVAAFFTNLEDPPESGEWKQYFYVVYSQDQGWTWTLAFREEVEDYGGDMWLTYATDKFILVDNLGYYRVSSDGITWQTSPATGPTAGYLYKDGAEYISVGYRSYYNDQVRWVSPDGLSWEPTGILPRRVTSLVSFQGRFLAGLGWTGSDEPSRTEVMASDDGRIWSFQTLPARAEHLVQMADAVVGYSQEAQVGAIVRTTDGSNWVAVTLPEALYWDIAVTSGNTLLLYAAGVYDWESGVTGDAKVAKTTDGGLTWTISPLVGWSQGEAPSALAMSSGLVVGYSAQSGRHLVSADGINWTEAATQPGPFSLLFFGLGQFWAFSPSEGTAAYTSLDGDTWTEFALPKSAIIREVFLTEDNKLYVNTTGNDGFISEDGVAWEVVSYPYPLLRVLGANGRLFGCGNTDVAISDNNVTWVSTRHIQSLTGNAIYGVFGNDVVVFLGENGQIITVEDDKSEWFQGQSILKLPPFTHVGVDDTRQKLLGTYGTRVVAYSEDSGRNWHIMETLPVNNGYEGVYYLNGRFWLADSTSSTNRPTYYTEDAVTWVSPWELAKFGTTYNGSGVVNGKAVVAFNSGSQSNALSVVQSTDLDAWYGNVIPSGLTLAFLTYFDDKFLAYGTENTAYSADGWWWRPKLSPEIVSTRQDIGISGTTLVMLFSDFYLTSSDGLEWVRVERDPDSWWPSGVGSGLQIAMIADEWRILTSYGSAAFSSDAGATWDLNYALIQYVKWSKTKDLFYAQQSELSNYFLGESPDGYRHWTRTPSQSGYAYLDELPTLIRWYTGTGNNIYAGKIDEYVYNSDTDTWSWMDSVSGIGSNALSSIQYQHLRYVADRFYLIGGAITWSEDEGATWKSQNNFNNEMYRDILYDGSRLVVLGNRHVVYSDDGGDVWQEGPELPIVEEVNNYLYAQIYAAGKFIALRTNSTRGMYSTDGLNWTEIVLPVSAAWQSLAYSPSLQRFVAVSSSTVAMYSDDGITWAQTTLPRSTSWSEVVWGNGRFVTASNTTYGAWSEDGVTWVASTVPAAQNLIFAEDQFMRVSNQVSTSPDGVNWTSFSLSSGTFVMLAYGADSYLAINAFSAPTSMLYSAVGLAWENQTMDATRTVADMIFAQGRYIGVSASGRNVFESDDGYYWRVTSKLPVSANWRKIVWDGDQTYMVSSDSAVVALSVDGGGTWEEIPLQGSAVYGGLAYGNGRWVATVYNSYAVTDPGSQYSLDGRTWAISDLPRRQWRSVAFGNGRFVAFAYNSAIAAWSVDGETWTEVALPSSGNWDLGIYGAGEFVATIPSAARVARSTDGETWEQLQLPVSQAWSVLQYLNGRYYLIPRYSSEGIQSPDLKEWYTFRFGGSSDWSAMAGTTGSFVITSRSNAAIVSGKFKV